MTRRPISFSEFETADLSASLEMTKERLALRLGFGYWWKEQQVPPLRFAPVGMTNLLQKKIVIPSEPFPFHQ
jgi:hypothetical protein